MDILATTNGNIALTFPVKCRNYSSTQKLISITCCIGESYLKSISLGLFRSPVSCNFNCQFNFLPIKGSETDLSNQEGEFVS